MEHGMALIVYGIPNCGTVKKARAWLQAEGVEHRFHDVRAEPLPAEQVAGWVATLGAKALKNTSGGSYRALPDDKKQWSDARWAQAMADDPMLIKRPVIERDGVAVKAGFRGTDEALRAVLCP
jgi:arsenate reductase